jgi:hypothetical protein
MIRLPATPLAVGKGISLALVILFVACTRVMLAPGTGYSGEWNTELPSGVSSSADSFRIQLRAVPGVRYTRLRAGAVGGRDVRVSIQSIADTRSISPDSAPESGLAVALIQNLDARDTEGYYGFRPSAVADYYFWVDRRPGTYAARITVLEVPRGGGPVRAGRQKNLQYCHRYPPTHHAERSEADFVEYRGACTAGPPVASANIVQASFLSAAAVNIAFAEIATALRAVMLISQGGWIDCNLGCCT